ncbi:Alpha/beta hydrolase fold-1 [Mycena galericulata]|nr:Alpha/beta hydrolase fold-1 [Mycena galericulata]
MSQPRRRLVRSSSRPYNITLPHPVMMASRALVFLHAMSLHKETFMPMLHHLLATSTIIKDVWSIDNPNHGRSSSLNQVLLAGPTFSEYCKYRLRCTYSADLLNVEPSGSAAEYARAAYSFLTSTAHDIDFSGRRLVGLAHSSAVSALMMLLRDKEFSASLGMPLRFSSLILLDPALLPPQFPSTTWPTRAAAHQYLAAHPAFKAWDACALQLFVDCALRDSGSEVVLSCSKAQEAAFYLSPTADYISQPVEIFIEIVRADALPIHIITCLHDEYKGQTLPSKEFQIAQVESTTRGSVQVLDRGGHMASLNPQFPQAEPALCAAAIQRALSIEQTKARM